jgi:hypothetical protein
MEHQKLLSHATEQQRVRARESMKQRKSSFKWALYESLHYMKREAAFRLLSRLLRVQEKAEKY